MYSTMSRERRMLIGVAERKCIRDLGGGVTEVHGFLRV
jgi:hypothetical protein